MSDSDPETQAMGQIAAVISGLQEEQRGRVIRYIVDRFKVDIAHPRQPKTVGAPEEAAAPDMNREFQDFASLFEACGPNTDSLRALVGAYWLQVCQSNQGFDGQSVNRELKNLGHGIANITQALNPLIAQKPAFVLQLRKSGTTKQARKLYKVTEAGIKRIKEMIAGAATD